MKIFTQKSTLQKIIITIVIVILFNFIAPNISMAKETFGGVLFTPIQALIIGLGDGIMYIISSALTGESVDNILTISTDSTLAQVGRFVLGAAGGAVSAGGGLIQLDSDTYSNKELFPEKLDLPIFAVTPDKIFANEVPFLNVNIINPKTYYTSTGGEIKTPTKSLQSEISGWYLALRNLAIVAMLSILVYIGIRIIISSNSADKAKYKNFIKDWIIAICLLFFMHYIMSFALTMVEELTKALKSSINVPVLTLNLSKYQSTTGGEKFSTIQNMDYMSGGSGDMSQIKWTTDFTGLARFKAQLNFDEETVSEEYIEEVDKGRMAYTLIYAVLVMYTVMFVFQYLKRLIYIIFLTMIAPLVAMTYPIDKMNDGSAQAFNMWFKEYIFNLLLQPFHLLIYSVLIGTSMELASKYLLYTLAVLGFMLPAEKILRKFFGFEKAGAGSSFLGGAVGGAMAMNAINAISGRVKGGAKKVISGGSKGEGGEIDKVRWQDRSPNNPEEEDKFLMDTLGGNSKDDLNDESNYNLNDESNYNLNDESKDNLSDEDYALEKYKNDGFLQNENGEYFNPYTDEYDPDYDPRNDKIYMKDNEIDIKLEETQPNEKVEQNSQPEEQTRKAIGGASKKLRRLRAVAPIVGRGALNVGKGLGKGVIKAYGAAAIGTIGIAAGLASEDYSNVIKYGVAGATTGSALAGTAINKGKELPSAVYRKTTAIKDEYKKNLYKDDPAEYKQYMREESDKAFMKDKDVQRLYKEKFGEREVNDGNGGKIKEYKLAMQKAKKYREHGITDNDVIIKAMKANVKGVGKEMDSNQRIAAAKYANQVSNEKDIQTMSDRLNKRGVSQDKLTAQEDMLRQIKGLN